MRIIMILLAIVLFSDAADAKSKAMSCRDSKTGKYVSHAYAKHYPGLTTCEKK
jgi:hypothetical protein